MHEADLAAAGWQDMIADLERGIEEASGGSMMFDCQGVGPCGSVGERNREAEGGMQMHMDGRWVEVDLGDGIPVVEGGRI